MDVRVSKSLSERRMVRVIPGTMPRQSELPRTRAINAAGVHLSYSGSTVTPLFPVTAPNTSSYPAIKLRYRRPVFGENKVVHPTLDVEIKLSDPFLHRDSIASSGKFPDAMLEFIEGINGPANSLSWESKPQELSLIRLASLTLCTIDLEL